MLLRIDDTDPARNVPGGEEAILRDLEWLGVGWDEGPVRQSERQDALPRGGRAPRRQPLRPASRSCARTGPRRITSPASSTTSTSGSPTSSAGTTTARTRACTASCTEALGAQPPEYIHLGLILGDDGRKLSKRELGATVASLRDAGIPAEAVRALPRRARHPAARRALRPRRGSAGSRSRRSRRLPDEELAARVGAPVELVPALRGARDLDEAREFASIVLEPERSRSGTRRGRRSSASASCASGERRRRSRRTIAARAEGCRRRPARAAACADRTRARARALGRVAALAARRNPAEDRCGSMTR